MKKYFVPDEALADDARDLENAVTAEIRQVYLASDVDALPLAVIIETQAQTILALREALERWMPAGASLVGDALTRWLDDRELLSGE